jgi:hypothetical protein
MKKFLIKVALHSCIIVIIIIGTIAIVSPLIRDPNAYMAATIDKENRLHILNSHKIIFVGGSNLAFGIDSKSIENKFNYPVVNMGIHGGLGLSFMLKEALDGVKESDIVLLSTEYYLDDQPQLVVITQLLDLNPRAKQYIPIKIEDLIPFYAIDFHRCVHGLTRFAGENFTSDIYRRDAFTVEGDVISHLNKKSSPIISEKINEIDYTHDLTLLNAFIDSVKIKKAKVYYLFPTYQKSSFALNKKAIDDFATLMEKNLKCSIINTPYSFQYNDSLFFDNEYHLNKRGRELRTAKLVEILGKGVFKTIIN